jgi:hypothetical protein
MHSAVTAETNPRGHSITAGGGRSIRKQEVHARVRARLRRCFAHGRSGGFEPSAEAQFPEVSEVSEGRNVPRRKFRRACAAFGSDRRWRISIHVCGIRIGSEVADIYPRTVSSIGTKVSASKYRAKAARSGRPARSPPGTRPHPARPKSSTPTPPEPHSISKWPVFPVASANTPMHAPGHVQTRTRTHRRTHTHARKLMQAHAHARTHTHARARTHPQAHAQAPTHPQIGKAPIWALAVALSAAGAAPASRWRRGMTTERAKTA